MGITINGSSAAGNIDLGTNGTITDLAVGGVPDNTIDNGAMADDSVGIAELSATGTASSSTYLRGDNSWATVSAGAGGATGLSLNDGVTVELGSDGDMEVYHSGSHGFVQCSVGNLIIRGKTGEDSIKCIPDGAVELYHNNVKMANTASNGFEITKNTYFKTTVANPPSDTNDGAAFLSTDTDAILRSSSGSYTGSANHGEFWNGNGQQGSISTNGSSTSYNTSSDYRLKENAVAISDGITRLKTLKPYRFNWKADANKTVDGFFAHEVTAVPEAVKGTKDAVADKDNATLGIKKDDPIYQQIDQAKLTPLLTAALQEAITKIETLETKVAALEAG